MGMGVELRVGWAAAAVTAGGSDSIVRLAGNQPTARVRWFWPLHSDSSRLQRGRTSTLLVKVSLLPNKQTSLFWFTQFDNQSENLV